MRITSLFARGAVSPLSKFLLSAAVAATPVAFGSAALDVGAGFGVVAEP